MEEIPDLFENGNFLDCALASSSDCWQHYAALGLIGVFGPALDGLARFGGEEALFYTGATLWIQGNESLAEVYLKACNAPEARKLLALLQKPRIDILSQVPTGTSCQYVPDFTEHAEPRFRIKNIGVNSGQAGSWSPLPQPGNIHEYVRGDFRPDFFLCREIEWQPVPPNLHELECPVFCHTEDYDIHLQATFPWYRSFSRVITCGSYEWRDLSRMLPVPVSTFPMAYSLPNGLPEIGSGVRDIDLFLSGTIFHPYHTDKARLVHRLLAGADKSLNLKVVSKHMPAPEYFSLLGRTKICLPFVRFDGSMPTRGLESLAMGNALILQKGCSLAAYFGEEDGVFTCDYWNGELENLIGKISKNWADIAPRAARGARRVREEFSMKNVSSRYLRFLTVMAAVSAKPKTLAGKSVVGKRSVVSVGWTHDADFYLESLSVTAAALAKKPASDWEASELNDFAREILLFYVAGSDPKIIQKFTSWGRWPVAEPTFLYEALKLLRCGVKQFPRFLALHFNLMRTLYHFGGDKARAEARGLAERIVGSRDSEWDLSVMDDVMPWDFFPEHFNYREYFDLGVKVLGSGGGPNSELCRLVRASSAHYASLAGAPLEFARTACSFDPAFALYRIDLARRLAASPDGRKEAAGVLAQLALEDLHPLGAWAELEKLGLGSELPVTQRKNLAERIARIQSRIEK